MIAIYQELLKILDSGRAAALCTVVHSAGSSPQKSGSKMLVHPDGSIFGTIGGGAVEHAVVQEAQEVLSSGQARLFQAHLSRDLAMCCGGRMEIFIEPVGDRPWLLVFGGGHVGQALCSLASQAGFRVHVIDEREEFCAPERHPQAARISCADPLEALASLPWSQQTFAVIVTHSHRTDEDLLARCVSLPSRYLGMIGSRAKVHRFLKRYRSRGLDMNLFSRVHMPIGLGIGAREPAEIAVSILAELVAVRRGMPEESLGSMRLDAAKISEPLPREQEAESEAQSVPS